VGIAQKAVDPRHLEFLTAITSGKRLTLRTAE
jgi:hypothetical protein